MKRILVLPMLFFVGCSTLTERQEIGRFERVDSTSRRGWLNAHVKADQGRVWLLAEGTVEVTEQVMEVVTYRRVEVNQAMGIKTTGQRGEEKVECKKPDRQRNEPLADAGGRAVIRYSGRPEEVLCRLDTRGSLALDISDHIRRAYEDVDNREIEIILTIGILEWKCSLTRQEIHKHYMALK